MSCGAEGFSFTLPGCRHRSTVVGGSQMKVVSVRHRFGSVAGAATAVAVAASVVVAPPEQFRAAEISPQIHAVELQAVTAIAGLNVMDGVSVTLSQTAPRSNATASAAGSPNLLAVAAAIGLGAVLLPLWYLTAPVTLPMTVLLIGAFGGVCSGCYSGSSRGAENPLANIILPGLQYWLTGPIQGFVGASRSAGTTAAGAVKRKVRAVKDVRQPRAQAVGRAPTRSVSKSKAPRPGNTAAKRAVRSAG